MTPGKGAALQRAGMFAELPSLLMESGCEPASAFAGTSIDPEGLRHDSRVPMAGMLLALDQAARLLACPHLGLVLGSRYSNASHGLLGRLMSAAPTLRVALSDFVTWQQGYSSAAVVYLNRYGDDFALGYGSYDRTSPGTQQLYDAVAAIACRLVRELTRGLVTPVEVLMAHRRPLDVAPYQKLLAVPVRFNQEQTCIVIDARSMDRPLPGADPAGRSEAKAAIEAALADVFRSVASRTRHIIRPLLHDSRPRMEDAARVLDLHPRTLRRRLAAEGVTYEALRDDVRFTLARELLDMTDLPISTIASALAYATHGAFIDAFRRWAGVTPHQWRLGSQQPATGRSSQAGT
jgi:AraC-like DNA-binding protein